MTSLTHFDHKPSPTTSNISERHQLSLLSSSQLTQQQTRPGNFLPCKRHHSISSISSQTKLFTSNTKKGACCVSCGLRIKTQMKTSLEENEWGSDLTLTSPEAQKFRVLAQKHLKDLKKKTFQIKGLILSRLLVNTSRNWLYWNLSWSQAWIVYSTLRWEHDITFEFIRIIRSPDPDLKHEWYLKDEQWSDWRPYYVLLEPCRLHHCLGENDFHSTTGRVSGWEGCCIVEDRIWAARRRLPYLLAAGSADTRVCTQEEVTSLLYQTVEY